MIWGKGGEVAVRLQFLIKKTFGAVRGIIVCQTRYFRFYILKLTKRDHVYDQVMAFIIHHFIIALTLLLLLLLLLLMLQTMKTQSISWTQTQVVISNLMNDNNIIQKNWTKTKKKHKWFQLPPFEPNQTHTRQRNHRVFEKNFFYSTDILCT